MNKNQEKTEKGNAIPEIRVGERIQLKRDVERFPHFIAKAGARGKIVEVNEYSISAKMDDKLESCKEWDNCVIWYSDQFLDEKTMHSVWLDVFNDDVEVIAWTMVQYFEFYGFKVEDTGGGCQWLRLPLSHGLSLVVTDGEAALPDALGAQMFLMSDLHGDPLMETKRFDDTEEMIGWMSDFLEDRK